MKIDYVVVLYDNYYLLDLQVKNFRKRFNRDDYRLIVVDNTPDKRKSPDYANSFLEHIDCYVTKESTEQFDGISHGSAIDFGLQYCESSIIGIIDSDFFPLNRDIHKYINNKFDDGYKAVGCEYNDGTPDTAAWVNLNPKNFENIPVCFGAYYSSDVAKAASWVITPDEVNQNRSTGFVEVGYRIRKHILDNSIKTTNWKTGQGRPCFFKDGDTTMGVHYVAGSHRRNKYENLSEMYEIIEREYG
jgi:hypothetical protein